MQDPLKGIGLGYRSVHCNEILEKAHPAVSWFEILAENHIWAGGPPITNLKEIAERYPTVVHSVGLSLAGQSELDYELLNQIKKLIEWTDSIWLSDHLCWSEYNGVHFHDLLPFPFTPKMADHVVDRIRRVQDFMSVPFIIENISQYLQFPSSIEPEWEFLVKVLERADCDLLLDINNIYVNSVNFNFDPKKALQTIPAKRVRQIHLAGHAKVNGMLVDTHGTNVADAVWDLYRFAIELFGQVPTMIEWDNDIPAYSTLVNEAQKAERILYATPERKPVATPFHGTDSITI